MKTKAIYVVILIVCSWLDSIAQKNNGINNGNKEIHASVFYNDYLRTRKKHPGIDTNIMTGEAKTDLANTYIQKQYTDPCIYNSYWPIIGDTLIYVSSNAQKVCVVKEIDSCEKLNKKYPNGDIGDPNHEYFFVVPCYECGIVARNIKTIDVVKENGTAYAQPYVFRYKAGEHYTIVTDKQNLQKLTDSIKAKGYIIPALAPITSKTFCGIPFSYSPKKIYYNFKNGRVSLQTDGGRFLYNFNLSEVIYVDGKIKYIAIEGEGPDSSENYQLFRYNSNGLISVIDTNCD